MAAKRKILIVDDERPTRDALARILSASYVCRTAPDGEQALAALAGEPDIALVLTDYKMPGMNGVELVRAARKLPHAPACILLTAFGEIGLTVEAMKAGASDFLTKPVTDLDLLEQKIANALEVDAPPAVADPAGERSPSGPCGSFTGTSPAMERVYRLIRKVAPTNATVLVEGPSGSGKELVARAIHALSSRAKRPFVALECAAFPRDLLAGELFGYTPGTFTGGLKDGKAGCFESAKGGTIFLDEIGEIDQATQVALLRVLETKSVRRLGSAEETQVDFRLVAATNRDLAAMVAEGTFREDLYYRLNVIDVRMPPLKDRPGDVKLLADHFLKEFSAANGGLVRAIAPDALDALETYTWPGNVRQLRNVIEKMVVLASGDTLTKADLPDEVTDPAGDAAARRVTNAVDAESLRITNAVDAESLRVTNAVDAESLRVTNADGSIPIRRGEPPRPQGSLADAEREQILATLERTGGNKSKAAEILGISRRTLHRKLNEWNLK